MTLGMTDMMRNHKHACLDHGVHGKPAAYRSKSGSGLKKSPHGSPSLGHFPSPGLSYPA